MKSSQEIANNFKNLLKIIYQPFYPKLLEEKNSLRKLRKKGVKKLLEKKKEEPQTKKKKANEDELLKEKCFPDVAVCQK